MTAAMEGSDGPGRVAVDLPGPAAVLCTGGAAAAPLGCCIPLPTSLRDLLDRPVFSVTSASCTWRDVFLAGVPWGAWPEIAARARAGLSLAARVLESDPLPPGALDAAALEFRYARGLVSRDEMEAWLGRFHLGVDAWVSWLRRDLLRRGSTDAPEDARAGASPTDFGEAVYEEALCSGDLERLAHRLAGRAAIADRMGGATFEEGDGPDASLSEHLAASGLDAAAIEAQHDRAHVVAGFERAYQAFADEVASPEAVAAEIRARASDLTRIAYRALRLPREEMVREALLSLTDDGLTLDEVAADAHAPLRDETRFLEELQVDLRARLLPALPGERLGPVALDGAPALVVVVAKTLPRPDDAAVRERARESLLARLVAREVADRVVWSGR